MRRDKILMTRYFNCFKRYLIRDCVKDDVYRKRKNVNLDISERDY